MSSVRSCTRLVVVTVLLIASSAYIFLNIVSFLARDMPDVVFTSGKNQWHLVKVDRSEKKIGDGGYILAVYQNALDKTEYYVERFTIKNHYSFRIRGNDCENLSGLFFGESSRGAKGTWESLLLVNGAVNQNGDKKNRQLRGQADIPLAGKFYCVPDIEHISSFFEKWDVDPGYEMLRLKEGPVLVYNGPILYELPFKSMPRRSASLPLPRAKGLPADAVWILGRYRRIESVTTCPDRANEFCVEMSAYDYVKNAGLPYYVLANAQESAGTPYASNKFRIFCWKCDVIERGTKYLGHSFLKRISYSKSLDKQRAEVYLLRGGVMVSGAIPEKDLNFIRHSIAMHNNKEPGPAKEDGN